MRSRSNALAIASVILMTAFLVSRATGLLREVVISSQFGTSGDYAAYLAAMRIPDFVFQVLAGGAVGSAFIPVFSSYLAHGRTNEAWRLASTIFNLAILVMLPTILLLMIFAPQVISLLTPDFPPQLINQAAEIAHILLVLPLLFALGVLSTSVLQSFNSFKLPSAAPVVYNLGLIFGAALLGPRIGIMGLAIGAAIGALLFFLIQLPGLMRVGMRYSRILDLKHAGVREVGRLMLPRTFGLAVYQINFVVILYLASPTPEHVPALNYAWQLTMLPLGIFAMAVSTAVFPTISQQSALREMEALKRIVANAIRLILFVTVPASIGLVVAGEPIVRLLFERGAFTPQSTVATTYALQFYALGLVGLAGVEITTRTFYALHDTRTPVIVATLAMLMHVVMSVFLVQTQLGYGGLALSMSLSSLFEAGALLLLAQRRLQGLAGRSILTTFLQSLAASALMATAALWLVEWFAPLHAAAGDWQRLLGVTLLIGLSGVIYILGAWALHAQELSIVTALIKERLPASLASRL